MCRFRKALSHTLFALVSLCILSCERESDADRISHHERDHEAGLVNEQGEPIAKPAAFAPRKQPIMAPERFLERSGPSISMAGFWGQKMDLGSAFPFPQTILLDDGNLLVTGGRGTSSTKSSAAIINPYSQTSTLLPDLIGHCAGPHIALKRPDGSVFLAFMGGTPVVGLFSPSEQRFTPLPAPWPGRSIDECGATLIPDGRVLLLSPARNASGKWCPQVFDFKERRWTLTNPPPYCPTRCTLTWLGHGQLLICGGWDPEAAGNQAQAMVFDPSTGRYRKTSRMLGPRRNHSATLLPTGMVLVAGGYDGDREQDTTDLFDPRNNTFLPGPRLPYPMARHASHLLGSGQLILTNGGGILSIDPWTLGVKVLYDPGKILDDHPEWFTQPAYRSNAVISLDDFGIPWLIGGSQAEIGQKGIDGDVANLAVSIR